MDRAHGSPTKASIMLSVSLLVDCAAKSHPLVLQGLLNKVMVVFCR